MTIQEEAWIFFQVFLLAKQSKFEAITPPISCNSLDNQRSGYQQHEQLALQPLDPALKSDEEIMLEILDYCNPCEPGTRNQLGQCFIPRQKFEWVVNRHALNGWVFQNHFNCVSAAVAGAINTVKQTNRTKPLVSARDIDFAFLVHAEANFLSLYKQLIAQYPEIDFKPVWEYLNSQPSSAFDNRNILEKLRETIDDDKFKEVFNDLVFVSVLHHYQRISRLLNPQVETSQHDISSIMQILPFGIKAYSVYEYSWRDLKEYLQTPNLAVLVRLPSHCALVFAAGENLQTGKERHVLVGRPSGGQSPCGWIPFMFSNKSPEEVLWRDEITLSGSIQSSTKYGLTMYLSEPLTKNNTNYFIGQRELIIIRADPAASRKEIHFSDYDLAVLDALFYSGPVYACDRCFAHNSICSSFVQ